MFTARILPLLGSRGCACQFQADRTLVASLAPRVRSTSTYSLCGFLKKKCTKTMPAERRLHDSRPFRVTAFTAFVHSFASGCCCALPCFLSSACSLTPSRTAPSRIHHRSHIMPQCARYTASAVTASEPKTPRTPCVTALGDRQSPPPRLPGPTKLVLTEYVMGRNQHAL